jgi:hypothetical protein
MRVPLQEGVEDNFGIAASAKAVAERFQFGANRFIVVNLAVEDDSGIAIGRYHRLIAAFEIDNLEPDRAETRVGRAKDPLLIRASMR